jgi:hypothetical protein
MLRGLALTVPIFLVVACGGSPSPSTTPAPAGTETRAYLKVENQSFVDLQMWVERANARQILGRSTANTTRVFTLPAAYVDPQGARIRFIANPVGTQSPGFTRELTTFPGDTVIITIPPF